MVPGYLLSLGQESNSEPLSDHPIISATTVILGVLGPWRPRKGSGPVKVEMDFDLSNPFDDRRDRQTVAEFE